MTQLPQTRPSGHLKRPHCGAERVEELHQRQLTDLTKWSKGIASWLRCGVSEVRVFWATFVKAHLPGGGLVVPPVGVAYPVGCRARGRVKDLRGHLTRRSGLIEAWSVLPRSCAASPPGL